MNISEDRTFVIEMAKRLSLYFLQVLGGVGVCREQRPLCCRQGRRTASTAEGRRPVPHPGSLCALGVGSRLRAPAERPAHEPHF